MIKTALHTIMPNAKTKVDVFYEHLNKAMMEFNINTVARQASFLSQIAHESGEFRYVKELASGKAYEGRKDLGNTSPGDGVRYKGRGLIQLTGKANYTACSKALGIDCVTYPELLEQPENACRVTAWFWKTNGLNALADAGDQKAVTRRVNGGYNGLEDRLKYYKRAIEVLK